MGALEALGQKLDGVLGALRPSTYVSRAVDRELQARAEAAERELQARGYSAARTTLSTGAWTPPNIDVNRILRADGPMLRARARELVRNQPHLSRAVTIHVDLVVGSGHELQFRLTDPAGQLIEQQNRALEELWRRFCDEADFTGQLPFPEIERLCKREEVEAGEWLLVRRIVDEPDRALPLAYQLVEAEQLTAWSTRPYPGNELYDGVEYDPRNGRKRGYWFQVERPTGTLLPAVRVGADQVLHGFKPLRANQYRGVTALAQGILQADALADLVASELDGSRMAAKWLAYRKTPDIQGGQKGLGARRLSDAEGGGLSGGAGQADRKVEEFSTGIMEWLLPGEEMQLFKSDRPGVTFAPFVDLILYSLCTATGTPFEMLTGKYQGLSYSTLRGARNDLAQLLRPEQSRHYRQLLRPVVRDFLGFVAIRYPALAPDYFANPFRYLEAAEFIPPGLEPLDPLKEGRAAADAAAALLDSEESWIRRRGRDPDKVLREKASFREKARKLGLLANEVPTGTNTAPSQLTRGKAKGAAGGNGNGGQEEGEE